MTKNIVLIIIFLFVANIFSQDDVFYTVDEDESFVSDTVETVKKISWYFSLSPRVGADKIQREYSAFLKEREDSLLQLSRKIEGLRYVRQINFQPPNASGILLYFETGTFFNFGNKTSLNVGIGYSFNRMKYIYGIEDMDSMPVLRASSSLINNSFSFSADYKICFDTSYFSIKGVNNAGFVGGAAFILSRFLERDTISSEFSQFSQTGREKYDGLGGSVKIGMFAQKNIAKNSIFEYSIGYMFVATRGYEDFWNRKYYSKISKSDSGILSISNLFILSFSFII